ncbi:RNA polymerase sigma factor [Streptomyces griseoruber]|uniref:RNA polymerase sigma-70 region 2 domain-containing protein n=1 Tax=Streptomyces griseoruber TaxID=1943 RepID=A0A101SJI8_9ACTN|nr:sigma-70 family RNA polymerase sigma factor [Streptomyces griseoruber]KUN75369.1 hypothetical protein AQJ64_42875 [Streptomyces griseoruber]
MTDAAARQLLEALYRKHAPMVLRTAARALRPEDHDLAEDIAQNVWLSTWQHLLTGQDLRSPVGFLRTRTRRTAIDHYRLARVRREQAIDYTDDLAVAHLARLIGAPA